MLSYDIRDLEHRAAAVDGWMGPEDPAWIEGDPRPAAPVHATGRISPAGPGRFYWNGRIEGMAKLSCRRCLSPLTAQVAEDVRLLFVQADDAVAEEPDVFRIPPHARTVDVRPAIREQWLLSAPSYAVCREDCKGLCPRCGADLNAGPCGCGPETDTRWNALRKLRDTFDE
ncbi:MAG TPA: DUF177 domain-containing protein [Gemmatimonadaceae bacterium]|nr:DUF177 domain-containing protein [Gemmatimonadaceae bacterium]